MQKYSVPQIGLTIMVMALIGAASLRAQEMAPLNPVFVTYQER